MPNTANVTPDGPIHVKGNIVINGETKDEVWLCRCGKSGSKPFCDGSHRADFTDAAAFEAKGDPGGDEAVTLTPYGNGPVGISGPISVSGADGTQHVTKGAFCRCGQSGNKPWCDGAHKSCGFEAP